MVDVGDLGCRVLNLENESTYTHTHTLRIPRMSRDPIGSNKYMCAIIGNIFPTCPLGPMDGRRRADQKGISRDYKNNFRDHKDFPHLLITWIYLLQYTYDN